MKRFFWLAPLLLACALPFLAEESRPPLAALLPAAIAITALYVRYVATRSQCDRATASRDEIHAAFAAQAGRIDEDDRRLCAALHDELNPCLIFSKRQLEEGMTLADANGGMAPLLEGAIREIDRAYAISRNIIRKVHVEIVDSIGLIAALDDLVAHYSAMSPPRPGLQHNLTRKTEQSIDRLLAISIYRIVREALLNAVRHARARTLLVSVEMSGQPGDLHRRQLRVRILDDGIGMPLHPGHGVGLTDMRIRALEAGGTLSISQGEDQCGTLIEVLIPLH